jgi:hypothetical protein
MVSSSLSDSFDSKRSMGDGREAPVADYLETIAILQEEVERLEQELQFQAERQGVTAPYDEASIPDEAGAAGAVENGAGEGKDVEWFKAELVSREETIRLLLDELSLLEEAQAATRAEWEQLAEWVSELEHRVAGQDGNALYELENRLAAQQQKADALQLKSEQDRRAWEAQGQLYQNEIARLQTALCQVATSSETPRSHDGRDTQGPSPDTNVVEALTAENLRLRAAWQELVERVSAADRSESLEAKLAGTLNEQQQLRRRLEQIEDERNRERLEHAAKVGELQARLSEASLIRPEGPPPETRRPEGISTELDVELRFRALRQNLLEIDQRAKEERRQKHLITRLSRLWSRTGPR